MKLYELKENYIELMGLLDNEEVTLDEVADTLDAINDELPVKVDNICRLMKSCESHAAVYKEEAKRLTALAKAAETKADNLKRYIDETFKGMNVTKMDTELFKLSYRKSESVNVTDVDALPVDYTKVTIAPDKTAIKKAIKDGVEVTGAELVTNQNLQIR